MLEKLRPYPAFSRQALAEDYKHWKWRERISKTIHRADKATNLILGSSLSAVVLLTIYAYRDGLLQHKRWIAIAVLSVITAFLLWLIGATKRLHERTINKSVWIAENLSSRATMLEEHFTCRRQPADKEFLEAWLNGAAHDIKDALGVAAVERFYEGSGEGKPVPNTLDAQIWWTRRFTGKLHIIVKEQYIPLAPVRLSKKKAAAARKAAESARAWVAKQKSK